MNRFIGRLAPVALIIACTTAAAEDSTSGERLLIPVPDGWEKVFHERIENVAQAEYVPEDQSRETSDEMITAQIGFGRANVLPDKVLLSVAGGASKRCDPFEVRPLEFDKKAVYPTLGIVMLCGSNTHTGQGELIFIRAIGGSHNFYIVRKIWHTPPFEITDELPVPLADRQIWLDYLTSIDVCDLDLKNCPESVK
ncbi:MAG: hypothetical protein AAEJ43_13185 [Gammaproteobacteria bacterium]